jgi:hypothetical protein
MGGVHFFFSITSKPARGPTQVPPRWVPRAVSPRVKWQEREALVLTMRSRMVKLYFHSQYVFMAWCLIKPRDIVSFTCLLYCIAEARKTWISAYIFFVRTCWEHLAETQRLRSGGKRTCRYLCYVVQKSTWEDELYEGLNVKGLIKTDRWTQICTVAKYVQMRGTTTSVGLV